MAKSRKKKTSKGMSTGTTLGALALIISIGALGLGLYQFIVPPATGPQFYILEYDDLIWLDSVVSVEYLYELNITYSTEIGDKVVIEFSCRFFIEAQGTTSLSLQFANNGSTPSASIYETTDVNVINTGYMRHTFEASTAGENTVFITASCNDEVDNWIADCLLTVTVY